jgi:hypothetical protein
MDIRHTHCKEIYVIERFVINVLWKRIILFLWVYTGARLDGKKILHFYGYWKMILFLRLQVTPILVDHDTGCIGKIISWYFHAYKERSNQRSYVSCALI